MGQAYRVYCVARGSVLVLLLCGGDKQSQRKDIELALALKKLLEEP